jgi:hypothetical protein
MFPVFGKLVFKVTSIDDQGRRAMMLVTEVSMEKMMLKFPTSFGEAVEQVFVGGRHVASADLRDLSDRGLADIGLTGRHADFEGAKPFWIASFGHQLTNPLHGSVTSARLRL